MRAQNNFKKGAVEMLLLHILKEQGDCYGYQFSKQENTDYFNQYDWYRNMPKETDMNVVAAEFSSVEKKNVEALQAYEDSKNWD